MRLAHLSCARRSPSASGSFVVAAPAAAIVTVLTVTGSAAAQTQPFTERFRFNASGWRDGLGAAELAWFGAGGPSTLPPTGPFVRGQINFSNVNNGDTPIFARGQNNFNSSNNAFTGNWLTGGITTLEFDVRQDTGGPVSFFVRVAGPNNTPAVSLVALASVPSGQWTRVSLPISASYPGAFPEGPPSVFNATFGNVGRLQFGVLADARLAGLGAFNFDLTNVGIVPAPASAGVMLLAGGAALRRRRR